MKIKEVYILLYHGILILIGKKIMETFIFNLNKNKKYKKIKENYSIKCNKEYGPWTYAFGFNNGMKTIYDGGLDLSDYYQNGSEIFNNNTCIVKYLKVIRLNSSIFSSTI